MVVIQSESSIRLSDFNALTLDVYGTLIDWENGIIEALTPLTGRLAHKLSRNEILEAHGRHESAQQRATPSMRYRDLLSVVYGRLAHEWGAGVERDEGDEYGRSIERWQPFPDSSEALKYLKQHYSLFVLSNVDKESFQHSNRQLGVEFDGIFTAEEIGSYKPDDQNFTYMIDQLARLGIEKSQILHTAESLFHDHAPANKAGIASCHIFRRHGQDGFGATMKPAVMPHLDFKFSSLAEMAAAHEHETSVGKLP